MGAAVAHWDFSAVLHHFDDVEARLDARRRAVVPGQLGLDLSGSSSASSGKGVQCGASWIDPSKTCRKGAGTSNPEQAGGKQGANQGLTEQPFEARRSRPKERVAFENAIVGPSGARLLAYTWQYTLEEVQDQRGETVERRVSDWEKSIASVETGRNVVHQFEVEHQGEVRVVSAESALKLMGYTDPQDRKAFTSLKSTARTVARLRMAQQQLDEMERKWTADWDEVEQSPRPEIKSGEWRQEPWGRRREWTMGGVSADQIDNALGVASKDDIYAQLNTLWKAEQMEARGWSYTGQRKTSMTSKLRTERADLARRLQRAEAKLQQGGRTDAMDAFDLLAARLDAVQRKCKTGYGCGRTCISVQKECRSNPRSATSKERVARLGQLARGEIKPRGIGVLKPAQAKAKAKALQAESQEQQAVVRAERARRKAEAAQTGGKAKVDVQLRRAKPGGEYGPDGHWYPGGSWMSEGAYVGAKPENSGQGQAGGGSGRGQEGGDEPRVIRPKQKPRRLQPTEPKGEGLPKPPGLKKVAEKNDQEFFNSRGYIAENLKYGDGMLGGNLFRAAVAQRMTTDELNWATDQIARMVGTSRQEIEQDTTLDQNLQLFGGNMKELLDYERSFNRNQLSGVDDERLKAAIIFMEASRYLGTSSPAQKRLRERQRSWDDEAGEPPKRKERQQGNRKPDPGYGDWIWGLNNVFRAVRIRRERGAA